jgi:hypothetical protein
MMNCSTGRDGFTDTSSTYAMIAWLDLKGNCGDCSKVGREEKGRQEKTFRTDC